jgi:hypothetical protein
MLVLMFISVSLFLVLVVFSIIRKHRSIYLQGKITRSIFLRNTAFEMFGILLAMVLAGTLRRLRQHRSITNS